MHPGVSTATNQSSFCTANFVFEDAAGDVFLGQAAHCAGNGMDLEATGPDGVPLPRSGCTAGSLPLGTRVDFPAAGVRGELAYSSWRTMQEVGEDDPDTCKANDFALVRVPKSAIRSVNPTVPVFGGPDGINTDGPVAGESVVGYGSSPTRQEIEALKPREGVVLATIDGGWSHLIYTLTPGIPGDSGGPYLDEAGRALGSLTLLIFAPFPLSNAITDIGMALDYAREHSGIKGLKLAGG